MFGFHFLLVWMFEWLTVLPETWPLPQISHFFDIWKHLLLFIHEHSILYHIYLLLQIYFFLKLLFFCIFYRTADHFRQHDMSSTPAAVMITPSNISLSCIHALQRGRPSLALHISYISPLYSYLSIPLHPHPRS